MRWLIDGYNLMHASGAAGPPDTTPEAFQRRRRRFLGELAEGLGPRGSREATVVFDANSPPRDFALETTYKGMRIIFALGDENADARIEQLIDEHSTPKTLTVVSSDRRVRQAAARRKAKALTSDQFLDLLDRWLAKRSVREAEARNAPEASADRPDSAETAYWIEQFRDLDAMPEIREAVAPDAPLLTDAEVARIQREVDREMGDVRPARGSTRRKPPRSGR